MHETPLRIPHPTYCLFGFDYCFSGVGKNIRRLMVYPIRRDVFRVQRLTLGVRSDKNRFETQCLVILNRSFGNLQRK